MISIEIRGTIRPTYVTQNSFVELVSFGMETVKSAANATQPILMCKCMNHTKHSRIAGNSATETQYSCSFYGSGTSPFS